MKRSGIAFVMAAGVLGCQSPGAPFSSSWKAAGTGPAASGTAASQKPGAAIPPAGAPTTAARKNPDIQQVGYNQGWGAMQNRSFHQRVARAVPSHGGALPGGPAMVGPGPATGPGQSMAAPPPGPAMAGPGLGSMGGPPLMVPGAPGMMPTVPLGPRFVTGRTQVRFIKPQGMQIAWQSVGVNGLDGFTPAQLEVPARYNFAQARIYRLKLTNIANRASLELYPTLEVYPGNAKIDAYLAHNAVPIEFTDEDFDQVQGGNFVTKVIYLPDPAYQELAIAGVETLVSTRLDPGVDPVQEANRRGAILAVVRMGGVDLEMQHSPPLFPTPVGPMGPPGMLPPAGLEAAPIAPAEPATPAPSSTSRPPAAAKP